jgi:hypothetical protein
MAAVIEDVDLQALAAKATLHHTLARQAGREMAEHACRAGQALQIAKDSLRHGEWLPWVKANLAFSERTAQVYMAIAKRWSADPQRAADLSIRGALDHLAGGKEQEPTLPGRLLREAVPLDGLSRPARPGALCSRSWCAAEHDGSGLCAGHRVDPDYRPAKPTRSADVLPLRLPDRDDFVADVRRVASRFGTRTVEETLVALVREAVSNL